MRFVFVDKILSISPSDIWGEIYFPEHAPLLHDHGKDKVISPGLVGEGLGQLVSWKVMSENDFRFRPVYLFSEKLTIHGHVKPGSTVKLRGIVHEINDEAVIFSGEAYVGDELIQELKNCTNYFLPVEEVEDPIELRAQFQKLITEKGDPILDESSDGDFSKYIKETLQQEVGKVVHVRCQVDKDASFYKDHFPKRPITPIVVINEIMSRATSMILDDGAEIFMREVNRVKIKSFVAPGEIFDIKIEKISGDNSQMQTMADVYKDGTRILRGQYRFDVNQKDA